MKEIGVIQTSINLTGKDIFEKIKIVNDTLQDMKQSFKDELNKFNAPVMSSLQGIKLTTWKIVQDETIFILNGSPKTKKKRGTKLSRSCKN